MILSMLPRKCIFKCQGLVFNIVLVMATLKIGIAGGLRRFDKFVFSECGPINKQNSHCRLCQFLEHLGVVHI